MLKLLLLVFLSFNIYAIDIDEHTSNIDILNQSYIYIDKFNIPHRSGVLDKKFVRCHKDSINLGFTSMTAIWIRFTLKNTQDIPITKILEYDNQEVEDIYLYDGMNTTLDGMLHIKPERFSINPIFEITLKPHQERLFYIKAHSQISTLSAKLVLWEKNQFLLYDQEHKLYLFLFFTIIITLLLYNFILYIFTNDYAYMYYVIYLFGVVVFQAINLGVAQVYLFSHVVTFEVTKASFAYISVLVIPIILFTREFLNTYQFPRIDSILKTYLVISPFVILFSYDNIIFNLNIIFIFIPLGFTIIYTGMYALYHGEKQAKFYIAGWTFVVISLLLSLLKAVGLVEATKYFYYMNEVAFVFEALLFSIALAHRIKLLSSEKYEISQKLITFQRGEQERLSRLVDETTGELKKILVEKDVLYKELNHRVKNNLQMILSLVKLQISNASSDELKSELKVTMDRINSISYLYERMNLSNEFQKVSTAEYCSDIVESLNMNFTDKVVINVNIQHDLPIEKLVYFGIIINELVTNALKYAFDESGKIIIDLYKEEEVITLIIKDNGKGFKQQKTNSLGLEIVKALVGKQLLGTMETQSDDGTTITIKWRENE